MRIDWSVSDESLRFIRFNARDVTLSLRDLDELEMCTGTQMVSEMHFGEPENLFSGVDGQHRVVKWASIHILCRKKRGYPRLPRNWLTLNLSADGMVVERDGTLARWDDDARADAA
jgi:hypothetical protein